MVKLGENITLQIPVTEKASKEGNKKKIIPHQEKSTQISEITKKRSGKQLKRYVYLWGNTSFSESEFLIWYHGDQKRETFWSDKKTTVKHEFGVWQKYLWEQRGKEIHSKMKENLLLADPL